MHYQVQKVWQHIWQISPAPIIYWLSNCAFRNCFHTNIMNTYFHLSVVISEKILQVPQLFLRRDLTHGMRRKSFEMGKKRNTHKSWAGCYWLGAVFDGCCPPVTYVLFWPPPISILFLISDIISLNDTLPPGVNILAFKPTMVGEKFPEIWG